jgi:hypothetical protein
MIYGLTNWAIHAVHHPEGHMASGLTGLRLSIQAIADFAPVKGTGDTNQVSTHSNQINIHLIT